MRLSLDRAADALELASDMIEVLAVRNFYSKGAFVREQVDRNLREPLGGVGNHTFTSEMRIGSIERNAIEAPEHGSSGTLYAKHLENRKKINDLVKLKVRGQCSWTPLSPP